MCGITGYIGSGNRDVLEKMTDSLQHRGPDEAGFFVEENVGLGHRRLSIIDLSTGKQPIFNENKSSAIIFNGEIYNFHELKRELEAKGHKFTTNTDTEVIIHLYEEEGWKMLKRLNGMFSIAIYDKNSNELLLARDRLGQKPLYYGKFKNTFLFGSELKAILKHPGCKKEINWDAFNKYLTYEYIPTPHSIFRNIYKLEPGNYLVYKNGNIEKGQYWDIEFEPTSKLSLKDAETELDKLVSDAVAKRLISDVPLGIFLSGGIDSSAIAYYAQKNSSSPIKTFSIAFADKSFDESSHARKVAKALKTDHHERILEPKDLLDHIPKIADIADEPIADASIVPTYLLSKFTRSEVTVALGGDGGDELFYGYPTFQAEKLHRLFKNFPDKFSDLFKWSAGKLPTSFNNISFDFKVKSFAEGIGFPDKYRHQIWLGTLGPGQSEQLLTKQAYSKINDSPLFEDIDSLVTQKKLTDPNQVINYLYLKQYLQDDILVKVDRASMANSLEVRAPFLDYRVVDFVTKLPADFKLNNWKTKFILKKMLADKLPSDIINRPKKGFGIPVARWIEKDLKDFTLDMLSEKKIKEQEILNYSFVKQLLDDHFDHRKDNRKILWMLIVWQMWLDKYSE